MATPRFSVITAVLNDGPGLRRTEESLANQRCREFEWIVLDGGSTDQTLDILRQSSVNPKWTSEPDKGIADAWNKGIQKALGEFIVILNAGDTFDPEYLETMMTCAAEDHITCCPARIADSDGNIVGVMSASPEKLWRGMHIPHNWCVVPKRFYEELGEYPLRKFGMDFVWFHRYYLQFGTAGFSVIPRVLGTYHLGGHSDRGYKNSFAEVERILREHGMNPITARLLRLGYTLKHKIVFRLTPHIRSRHSK